MIFQPRTAAGQSTTGRLLGFGQKFRSARDRVLRSVKEIYAKSDVGLYVE